jgi:D-amino-acid dehydrogenase
MRQACSSVIVKEQRIIIVGGGVIGVCCAYFLAKRGASVTLLERDEIGKGASFGNAGCIAPGHGPINKPGRIKQGLKSLLDPVSPLYIAPRWDPALARWLWEFSRYCSSARLDFALRALAPLSHATVPLFDEIIEEEGLECGYRREGYFEVFRTSAGMSSAKHEAELVRRHGFEAELLDGAGLRAREPALNHSVVGGVFFPQAGSINPYGFVRGLADAARRHGAEFRANTQVAEVLVREGSVEGVRTADGEEILGDALVLATGAYSPELVRQLGCQIPLQPAKGYHRDRRAAEAETPTLRVTCMLGERSVFCTPMDGFVRFAGTLEFSGVNHEMRPRRLNQLTEAAKGYFVGMGDAEPLSEWCGLRPCISDGLPVIGPVPGCKGAFIATGHAMLGLTLGPVTGKLMAECVLDGSPSIDIGALSPGRF